MCGCCMLYMLCVSWCSFSHIEWLQLFFAQGEPFDCTPLPRCYVVCVVPHCRVLFVPMLHGCVCGYVRETHCVVASQRSYLLLFCNLRIIMIIFTVFRLLFKFIIMIIDLNYLIMCLKIYFVYTYHIQPASFPAKVTRCNEWQRRLVGMSHTWHSNLYEELAQWSDIPWTIWRCLNRIRTGFTCSKELLISSFIWVGVAV